MSLFTLYVVLSTFGISQSVRSYDNHKFSEKYNSLNILVLENKKDILSELFD